MEGLATWLHKQMLPTGLKIVNWKLKITVNSSSSKSVKNIDDFSSETEHLHVNLLSPILLFTGNSNVVHPPASHWSMQIFYPMGDSRCSWVSSHALGHNLGKGRVFAQYPLLEGVQSDRKHRLHAWTLNCTHLSRYNLNPLWLRSEARWSQLFSNVLSRLNTLSTNTL